MRHHVGPPLGRRVWRFVIEPVRRVKANGRADLPADDGVRVDSGGLCSLASAAGMPFDAKKTRTALS